jgi:hypothetical protein
LLDLEGVRDDSKDNPGEKASRAKLDHISVIDALKKADGNKSA